MPPWIIPAGLFIASLVVALQSWILLELIRLRIDMERSKTQLDRIVSDLESEKDTRARANLDHDIRLRALELRHA